MIRRGSIVVPTGSSKTFHPWQVEWVRGTELRCIIGSIADPNIDEYFEWQPKNFPKGMTQSMIINNSGVSQRTFKKEQAQFSSKPYATGVKTGSQKVFYKNEYGKIVSGVGAQEVSASKGYVAWPESVFIDKSDTIYVVLHKVSQFWCLSLVDEDELEPEDIRIAVIKQQSGRHIADWELCQLWKSDISLPDNLKPLQAYVKGTTLKVKVGTIGNKIPTFNNVSITDPTHGVDLADKDDGEYLLRAECPAVNNGAVPFPSAAPDLTLQDDATYENSTDTMAYLYVASIYITGGAPTVYNFLSGSLWGERLKVTGNTATYYFNSI